jgi:hypothetical protein
MDMGPTGVMESEQPEQVEMMCHPNEHSVSGGYTQLTGMVSREFHLFNAFQDKCRKAYHTVCDRLNLE